MTTASTEYITLTDQPHDWKRQTRKSWTCRICFIDVNPDRFDMKQRSCKVTVLPDRVEYAPDGTPRLKPLPPLGSPKPAGPPATERQMAYIRRLVQDTGHLTMKDIAPTGYLTKAEASQTIEYLKGQTS